MKRFFAALLALMMLWGGTLAEGISSAPIATYTLPRGAEAVHLWESGVWVIPEGLEEMYRLMQTAELYGDVYLVRMPHGRAMVSVSCMRPDTLRTAEELKMLWPQIAQGIAQEGVSVNADESCATVETLYGFEALHIQTNIGLGQPGTGMQLDAEGMAFMRGEELLEVWAVAPVEGSYADAETEEELAADRTDMDAFMQSLSFTDLESMAVKGVPYMDPDGRFALVLPTGCTVITRSSTQEEVNKARQAYLDAHGEGAETFFTEYMTDVTEQHVTLVISEDQQLVAQLFASQEEAFRDVTADQLAQLAQPIQQTLSEKFDAALLLSADEQSVISGKRHAWLGYWLRAGEMDVQLDVLAAVLDNAWLYEVDLYTHGNDQQQRSLWYTLITQTMQYTPLTNALGE